MTGEDKHFVFSLLCRDEVFLMEQRTASVCRLRAALQEYYPVALQALDDWTLRSAWAFVEAFPTPAALTKAGKRKWEKFLHTRNRSAVCNGVSRMSPV